MKISLTPSATIPSPLFSLPVMRKLLSLIRQIRALAFFLHRVAGTQNQGGLPRGVDVLDMGGGPRAFQQHVLGR